MKDKVSVVLGDITKMEVDAIVNAANSSLMGGGGVDGAIHRAGGPMILEECRQIVLARGTCKTGEAVITGAGHLPARFVIHTVGPVWHSGQKSESQLLANCYTNSLKLALQKQLQSIAFPNISTGVYGYPKEKAALVAIETVFDFLQQDATMKMIYFVCFDEENYSIYRTIILSKDH